jgi:hypothetical protein
MMETAKVYVLTLVLFAGIPFVLDICLSYLSSLLSKKQTLNLLIDKASADKLDLEELKEFMKEIGKPPPGIPGLARAMMALTVIVILGIAVFHILVNNADKDNLIINNILSMLSGLLAAITGFYFGGKKSEEKKS